MDKAILTLSTSSLKDDLFTSGGRIGRLSVLSSKHTECTMDTCNLRKVLDYGGTILHLFLSHHLCYSKLQTFLPK